VKGTLRPVATVDVISHSTATCMYSSLLLSCRSRSVPNMAYTNQMTEAQTDTSQYEVRTRVCITQISKILLPVGDPYLQSPS
jgi:hypothetical protein